MAHITSALTALSLEPGPGSLIGKKVGVLCYFRNEYYLLAEAFYMFIFLSDNEDPDNDQDEYEWRRR